MAAETKMYADHCKGQFQNILAEIRKSREETAEGRKETQAISNRLFKTNGKRALVTCIEDNTKAIARHIDGDRPAKTIKRLKIGNVLDAQGYNGADIIKILLFASLLLYVVGRDYGPKMMDAMFSHDAPTELTAADR